MSDVKAQIDERRIARGVALGIPLATVVLALAAGTILGVSMAVLVLAAGVMLGAIALFWASIRVLSGDAALPPELEALDMTAHGVDALAGRKKMLLLALKDLHGEHAVGKLDDEDYDQIASTYRAELKDVMRRIDETLEPFRAKADEAARTHLAKVGLADVGYRGEQPVVDAPASEPVVDAPVADARLACPKCKASNEPDAKFCKECAEPLKVKSA
ncbi:MAG TPA: zinc ribbon domain-containing protein [Labilithrix sp.]|jgi:hypothetical protein